MLCGMQTLPACCGFLRRWAVSPLEETENQRFRRGLRSLDLSGRREAVRGDARSRGLLLQSKIPDN